VGNYVINNIRAFQRYEFQPIVAMSVPQVDADGDGTHDLNRQIIRVNFTPVSGASRLCDTSHVDMRVGSDGLVSPRGNVPDLLAYAFDNTLRRNTGDCRYDVTYSITSGLGVDRLMLAGSTTTIESNSLYLCNQR